MSIDHTDDGGWDIPRARTLHHLRRAIEMMERAETRDDLRTVRTDLDAARRQVTLAELREEARHG